MKKLFFAAVAALALVLSACESTALIDVNDPNPYCWALDAKVSVLGVTATETTYVWGTGEDLKYSLDLIKKSYKDAGIDASIKWYKVMAQDEETCLKKNPLLDL